MLSLLYALAKRHKAVKLCCVDGAAYLAMAGQIAHLG
jgi:hypothetical protein